MDIRALIQHRPTVWRQYLLLAVLLLALIIDGLDLQLLSLVAPLLISEWGYRAAGAGLPNTMPPAMVTAKDQTQRAAWTRNYLACAIDTNYVIGTHWFQFADQPKEGRGGDGENNNWGVVNKDGKVYTKVTDELARVPARAYARLAEGARPLPCRPVGLQR